MKAPGGVAAGKGTGGLFSSTMIFASAAFGASVLAIPWAIAQCGWAVGLLVLFVCVGLTQVKRIVDDLLEGRVVVIRLEYSPPISSPG
jgi:hypothetical protein